MVATARPASSQVSAAASPICRSISTPVLDSPSATLASEVLEMRREIDAQKVTLTELARQLLANQGSGAHDAASAQRLAPLEAAVEELRVAVVAQRQQNDLTDRSLRECLLELHLQKGDLNGGSCHVNSPSAKELAPSDHSLAARMEVLAQRVDADRETLVRELGVFRTLLVATEAAAATSTRHSTESPLNDAELLEWKTHCEAVVGTALRRMDVVELQVAKAADTTAVISQTVGACETALKDELGLCVRQVEADLRESFAKRLRIIETELFRSRVDAAGA